MCQADPTTIKNWRELVNVWETGELYESMSWMRLSSIPMGSRCIMGSVVLPVYGNYVLYSRLWIEGM